MTSTAVEKLDARRSVQLPGETRARVGCALLVLALVACGGRLDEAVPAEPAARFPLVRGVHYSVSGDPLERLSIDVCFEGATPRALEPMAARAARRLVEARSGDRTLPVDEAGRIDLRSLTGSCIAYVVDVAEAGVHPRDGERPEIIDSSGNIALAFQREGDLLISPSLFLWRPARWDRSIQIAIEITSQPGVHVSAAWPRDTDGVFHPDDTVFRVAGNVAFLRQAPTQFQWRQTDVEIARMAGTLSVDADGIERWIREGLRSATMLHGKFHTTKLHIVVIPEAPGERPVGFGLVRRGGGASVLLMVHETTSEEELVADWTATHELTHLGMPKMRRDDLWISEGFATYYQEVLRARSGLITEEQAWGALARGFERGRFDGERSALWEDRMSMANVGRIYWAGTAFIMDADIRLRVRGSSMDALVARFAERWRNTKRTWNGRDCMQELDQLLGAELATPLADEYGAMTRYPDTSELLAQLGVRLDENGEVTLDDTAPMASVRREITAPRPEPNPE